MTFEEMQEAVYTQLRDAPKEFIEDHFVETWLNEAQRDIAQRTKLLVKEITNLTVGAAQFQADSTVALPADFISLMDLRIDDQSVDFEVDEAEFWAAKDGQWILSPPWGRLFAGGIEVYPTIAANYAYRLRYAYMPADLSAPTDVSPFPPELQDKMVLFATARALYKEREDSLAATYRQEYELGLPQRTLGFGRKFTTPQRLSFELGPFDRDPEARHIYGRA
jgi:hypothetical protein